MLEKKSEKIKENEEIKVKEEHKVIKIQKENGTFWKISTFALGILLLVSIFTNGFNPNCNAVLQTVNENPAVNSNKAIPDDSNQATSVNLAKCLTEKGAIMYGAEWCGHCQNQKKMFAEDFQNINFIDCDEQRDKCQTAGIQGYPTWVINDQQYPGEQTKERLASLSGCALS